MVKCVVSGCPNRVVNVNSIRGSFNRPPKRFFSFPRDPARVKVWLAALRETDKQDSTEQHLICEDHFLPEDISTNTVNSDAIPIMPPYLDGPLGMISPWGGELSEEDDRWGGGGGDNEDDGNDDGGSATVDPPEPEPPAVDPPPQDPGAKTTSEAELTSEAEGTGVKRLQKTEAIQTKRVLNRQGMSLGMLTRRFLSLLLAAPDGSLDLRHVTASLQTRRRRVYDITNVLEGISLIEKQSASRIKWTGRSEISSLLQKNQQRFQRELENLKVVEDTLDTLIKSCSQQLFDMTDDTENASFAYVTHEDVGRLGAFQEQTVIVVKAPEETKLEVPAPKEDSIQIRLTAGRGPIAVLCSDIGGGEESGCFLSLEESRINTTPLRTESSSPQSAVQST